MASSAVPATQTGGPTKTTATTTRSHPETQSTFGRWNSSRGNGVRQRLRSLTSSSGADHGYGSMSISAGSSTRGPMPLGQI